MLPLLPDGARATRRRDGALIAALGEEGVPGALGGREGSGLG